jgi:hypothetical protein
VADRRRPTCTVVCQTAEEASFVVLLLLSQKQTFTFEHSAIKGVFYVGVLPEGEELVRRHYALKEAGVLGDFEPGIQEPS